MIKETIKYIDYRGNERTEDFYFNLNETEIIEMLAVSPEDLVEKFKKIVEANDGNAIMKTFKEFLLKSYGEISEDGRQFVKDDGKRAQAFSQTEAYNIMFKRLVTDADYAAKWVSGMLPQKA